MAKKSATKKVTTKTTKVTSKKPSINFMNRSFGISRAYLFEYGLLLLVVGATLLVLVNMLQQLVADIVSDSKLSAFEAESSFGNSVLLLSAALVLIPMLVVLTQRTAAAERINPAIKNTGCRKIFLGIFLSTVSISAIALSIYFVNSIMTFLTGANSVFDSAQSLGLGLSALIVSIVAMAFASDYRHVAGQTRSLYLHRARYALVFGGLIIASLFIVAPMNTYRDAAETKLRGGPACKQDSKNSDDTKNFDSDDNSRPLPLEEY